MPVACCGSLSQLARAPVANNQDQTARTNLNAWQVFPCVSAVLQRVRHTRQWRLRVPGKQRSKRVGSTCAGARNELTGFSSEDLNGKRGGIRGSYLDDRGRWPVVVDGTGRKLSCKSDQPQGTR